MKRIGLITGLGPISTVDYYLGIVDGYREHSGGAYPEIAAFNVDMKRMFDYMDEGDHRSIAEYFAESIGRLKSAGATTAAICCNTLHIVLPHLLKISPLPIISIVDATCGDIVKRGYKKVLLLGTLFTMQSDLYTAPLGELGVEVLLPSDDEKREIQDIIFPELEDGVVVPEKKQRMLSIASEIIESEHPDAVILGCTELPLMIKTGDLTLPLINTTETHIKAILDYINN